MTLGKQNKTENARRLREMINRGIRENLITFNQLKGGRIRAEMDERVAAYNPGGDDHWGPMHITVLVVCYTPDEFNYFHDVIELNGVKLSLNDRAYKNTIRKLSEWQVMQKLES